MTTVLADNETFPVPSVGNTRCIDIPLRTLPCSLPAVRPQPPRSRRPVEAYSSQCFLGKEAISNLTGTDNSPTM